MVARSDDSTVIYVTDRAPRIEAPPFEGERYEALVPATLDLAERCALAVHGMTSTLDLEADLEAHNWIGSIREGSLRLVHSYNDYNGLQPKWIETLPLLRTASGSTQNIDHDRRMMEVLFRMLGPDGLYWIPAQGTPWSDRPAKEGEKQIYNAWPNGRALMALCCWYERHPDEHLLKAIKKMVDGLARVAVYRDDVCLFHITDFPDTVADGYHPGPSAVSTHMSTIMYGLAYAYAKTGYEPARELGEKLARFIAERSGIFDAEGRITWVHTHGTTFAMLGLLEFATATGRADLTALVKNAYKDIVSRTPVILGWYPEQWPARSSTMEACQLGDMTILGVKLSEAGAGDYWENVEHTVRNSLQSCQVTDVSWLDNLAARHPDIQPAVSAPEEDARDVARRMLGTFNGMAAPGGFFQSISVGCCTGNGARALYFAWRHTVDDLGGEYRVNLLLNRASKAADIDSYLPYLGKVEITMKEPRSLNVRIPSWVENKQIECTVNGETRVGPMSGRYLKVGEVGRGDRVVVRFPLLRAQTRAVIDIPYPDVHFEGTRPAAWDGESVQKKYTLTVKGFNVIDIWPRGQVDVSGTDALNWMFTRTKEVDPSDWIVYPFYTRTDYRGDTPRYVKVSRFVPSDELDW